MISLKHALQIMDATDGDGKPVSFSIRFVKKSTGEIVDIASARLSRTSTNKDGNDPKASNTSKAPSHFENQTRNLVLDGSEQIRKVCLRLITRVNNQPVYY